MIKFIELICGRMLRFTLSIRRGKQFGGACRGMKKLCMAEIVLTLLVITRKKKKKNHFLVISQSEKD